MSSKVRGSRGREWRGGMLLREKRIEWALSGAGEGSSGTMAAEAARATETAWVTEAVGRTADLRQGRGEGGDEGRR